MTLEPDSDTTDIAEVVDLELQARSGDAAAFGKLIREYDDDLRGAVWSVLRNHHALDDVMQTSYEKAFKNIKTFDGGAKMKTWLHSICYRSALDYLRYEGRRRHSSVDGHEDLYASDITTSDEVISKVSLSETLSNTDPEVRGLLMLTAGLGYSYDEASAITGIERGTIASRVSRVKQKLRSEVSDDE